MNEGTLWRGIEVPTRRHLTEGVPNQGSQQSLGTSSAVSRGQEAQWTLFHLTRIKLILQLWGIKRYLSLLHYLFSQKITKTISSPLQAQGLHWIGLELSSRFEGYSEEVKERCRWWLENITTTKALFLYFTLIFLQIHDMLFKYNCRNPFKIN